MIFGPFTLTVGDYPDNTSATLETPVISGTILDVAIVPDFTAGTSVEVDIETTGAELPPLDILHLTGASAVTSSVYVHPRALIQDTNGADITDQYNLGISIHDSITIEISGGDIDTGDAVSVWFWVSLG